MTYPVDNIVYQMLSGFPGQIASNNLAEEDNWASSYNPAAPFAGYGLPGKIVASGTNYYFQPITANTDVVAGFLIRPFPTQGANGNDPLYAAVPATSGACTYTRKGQIFVTCNAGVPAPGGAVYVRYANGTTGTPVGGIEATSVGGSNIAIPNCTFLGVADANGTAKIGFNV